MNAYQSCLQIALQDAANRLVYLGYHGDALVDFLIYILSKEGFDAYKHVVAASDAAGYCPIVDRKSWRGRNLPDQAVLECLPEALEMLVERYAPDGGFDPVAALFGSGKDPRG